MGKVYNAKSVRSSVMSHSDKVNYWLELSSDDLITAKALLKKKRLLHMGFFCHMVAEKSLKAVVAKKTGEMPPKIHDLKKLAKMGDLLNSFTESQLNFLIELEPLNIEARYPKYKENIASTLTIKRCKQLFKETECFLCWIKKELEK